MMKKIIFLLLLLPVLVEAQSTDQNYIKSTTYKQPVATVIPNPTIEEAQVSLTYFDGLGRPIQQIAIQQSGSGKNIVTPIEYDAFGRQDKEYLPIPMSETSLSFTDNIIVISDAISYYTTTYGADGDYPFSEKEFEASPLNRVLEQSAPGTDWQTGANTIKMDYQTNTAEDEVKLFRASATYDAGLGVYQVLFSKNGTDDYPSFTLYKSIVKDENWQSGSRLHTTEEFKNLEGKVVLKRTFSVIEEDIKPHDTYYVYDQFGNLSYVLPPKAEGRVKEDILNGLCYQYKYDSRNRLVEKKIPGKEVWDFFVYDKLDRVVATGPVLSPFDNFVYDSVNGWMISKYDALSRIVLTGWKQADVNSITRLELQNEIDSQNSFSESKIQQGTPTEMNNVYFNYTNDVWPITNYHILTINYYDNYDYVGAPDDFNVLLDGENQVYYNTTITPRGLSTGSWVRVLQNSSDALAETGYTLYDKKSRPVRMFIKNHLGGFTQTDNKFDFSGKINYTKTTHQKDNSSQELEIREDFTYNSQDLVVTHTHEIVGISTAELLSFNEYDELGKVVRKSVGGIDTSGGMSLQKVDYSYNIRGWLKQINNIEDLGNDDPRDLFAFKINYNEVDNSLGEQINELYNGNIAETLWRTDGDDIKRSYGYQYDGLNRLLKANYLKNDIETHSYDESIQYDKNGNITGLQRNGYEDSDQYNTNYPIDNLYYDYQDNTNQLLTVYDYEQSLIGFKDVALGNRDFYYDMYGNLIADVNKGIAEIYYNHLNLPVHIFFNNGSNISYLYSALGVKLNKTVFSSTLEEGIVQASTDYIGGFQYKDNKLQFFPTSEGYVQPNGTNKFDYVYNYTDHLGNVRLSYCDLDKNGTLGGERVKKCTDPDPETGMVSCYSHFISPILEESHYYPFGLKHEGYTYDQSNYKYKYNGKEYQDELGLNMYDYGARNYDPALGRWMNIDNHADSYFNHSPYSYAINNPINVIDPDGNDIYILTWFSTDKNGGETGHAGIAIDNYKTQNKKDAKGKDILDNNGNPVTEQVKDGTFTYFDLWPNDPVGKTEMQDDVKADYSQGIQIGSLSDLMNTDPTANRSGNVSAEGRSADGIVKISSSFSQDEAAKKVARSDISSNKKYNACENNCSTYTQRVANAAGNSINATQRITPGFVLKTLGYKATDVIAPNNLYNEALKVKGASNIKGPKSVKARPYLEYFGK